MLEPVLTAPIFAVHGLLDGARGKGLATPEWLVGVLGRAGISESLLELEESRVTVEQFNALFIAVKDSLNDECLGYLHGRPMRGQLRTDGAQCVHCPLIVVRPAPPG